MANPYFGPQSGVSNAIGSFTIGLSPIGTIDPFNWADTVISQYANSPILLGIIAAFNDAESQTENFDNWFDTVWNVLTATGYGLDVWGRIVGVNRALTVDDVSYFGFNEGTGFVFGAQSFYGGPPTTGNYLLSDDAFRVLILAKAAYNISDGTIPSINKLLMLLFSGRGNVYVQEGNGLDETYFGFAEAGDAVGFGQEPFYFGSTFSHMTMRYVFDFDLTPVELAIVQQSGVMPTPVGVNAVIVVNP